MLYVESLLFAIEVFLLLFNNKKEVSFNNTFLDVMVVNPVCLVKGYGEN